MALPVKSCTPCCRASLNVQFHAAFATGQAQLNAATEVGEAFNKTRGDVRRERKLMQRVAALEEEVSQLKGQVGCRGRVGLQ